MSFNAAAAVHAKLIAMEWPSSSMERIKKANDNSHVPCNRMLQTFHLESCHLESASQTPCLTIRTCFT